MATHLSLSCECISKGLPCQPRLPTINKKQSSFTQHFFFKNINYPTRKDFLTFA